MKAATIICTLLLLCTNVVFAQKSVQLKNETVSCLIDEYGNLIELKNIKNNHNYAKGNSLWRMYYDTKQEKEIEVLPSGNKPFIKKLKNEILITYTSLSSRDGQLNIDLKLKISLDKDGLRFHSEIINQQKGTIIRELQYPLIGDIQILKDQQLLTTERGGNLYPDIIKHIGGMEFTFRGPDHKFRQMNVTYPKRVASNCFALVGKDHGLYFGSHDTTFVYTGHGIRLYPNDKGVFGQLELGIYKYPNCQYNESWSNTSNVIYPYVGTWHQTSYFYRNWVNTWWEAEVVPQWVNEMVGFQRVILKHQYGQRFFSYNDFGTKIREAGDRVGIRVGFPFGWWNDGMDNGYPDSYYVLDSLYGGRSAWKKAIQEFKSGGNKLMLYYNGKLIDTESEYYRVDGKNVSFKNATGNEMNEFYLFPADGSFTGGYNKRSFVVADPVASSWTKELQKMADDAIDLGADMVFYDQMGYAEDSPLWVKDSLKEFSVPRMGIIKDKAIALKNIRRYIHNKDKNVSLGIEHITDVTSQYVDFTHGIFAKGAAHTGSAHMNFIEWFRFTFPEIVLSARDVDGDEKNLKWLINRGVLYGLRHNLAVYRLRGLVTDIPHYESYLAEVNTVVEKHKNVLLAGTFLEQLPIKLSNNEISASSYVAGNQLAVVMTHNKKNSLKDVLQVPGYVFKELSSVGPVNYNQSSNEISIDEDGLAVIIFEKKSN